MLSKDSNGCPYLILAPMEGLGDRCFRKTMAAIGGFDEAVTEFMSVPSNAHVKSLAAIYQANETAPIPLAAQIMGSDPALLADMAVELEKRGARRIDLNCGCPSKTVTGRGAGSSLLKDPNFLHENASALVKAVSIPVTLKMRSGYADTTLFKENLLAAQDSGIAFLTLHPRTKVDGYGPPAKWDLIAEAKALLRIPVVGNGDILSVEDAKRMLSHTKCDALMIGRGSVMNPYIFHEIRHHFADSSFCPTIDDQLQFLNLFLQNLPIGMPDRLKVNKFKQIFSYLLKKNPEIRQLILKSTFDSFTPFFDYSLNILTENKI